VAYLFSGSNETAFKTIFSSSGWTIGLISDGLPLEKIILHFQFHSQVVHEPNSMPEKAGWIRAFQTSSRLWRNI